MDYSLYSKDALIQRIKQLERLNYELLKESDDELSYAWTGSLGRWYLDFSSSLVVFNAQKVLALGYTLDEIPHPTPYTFFTNLLHPDDYLKTMKSMLDNMNNITPVYEVEYRIRAKDGSYKWFYDRGLVTQRDENNKATFAAGIVFEITNKKEEEMNLLKERQEFKHSSLTDVLTGIMNRRAVLDELSKRMNRHIYNFEHLSIIMIDIDDFKPVNDKFGHLTGDKVLIKIAQKISESIRDFDTVGRYGGEEFLVILPNTDLNNAYKASERIRLNIENTIFEDVGKVTISAGYVEFKNETIDELIDLADQSLYKAKNAGKNTVYGNLQQ
jgi:diguanylate cyclase